VIWTTVARTVHGKEDRVCFVHIERQQIYSVSSVKYNDVSIFFLILRLIMNQLALRNCCRYCLYSKGSQFECRPEYLFCYRSFVQLLQANVELNSSLFWHITSCSPSKVYRRFGRTSPSSSGSKSRPCKKPAWSRQQPKPEDGGDMVLRNVCWLHGDISQKVGFFIATAVRMSN
jgi:hypothetical protein